MTVPVCSFQRLKEELLVLLLYCLLEIAVEHAHGQAVVLQVLDPLAVHRRVWVGDTHPDFLDSRKHNPLCAPELRMPADTGSTRF